MYYWNRNRFPHFYHFLYFLYYNFLTDLLILSVNVLLYSDSLGHYNATIHFFCCKRYTDDICNFPTDGYKFRFKMPRCFIFSTVSTINPIFPVPSAAMQSCIMINLPLYLKFGYIVVYEFYGTPHSTVSILFLHRPHQIN